MNQEQTTQFLASLVEVMVKAVKSEVLEQLENERFLSNAIHKSVDYDETFWQRITNHVNNQLEQTGADPSGRNEFEKKVDDAVDVWLESRLDDKIGDWMDSNLNDRMDTWMTDNFNYDDYGDINDKICEVIRNEVSFDVSVS